MSERLSGLLISGLAPWEISAKHAEDHGDSDARDSDSDLDLECERDALPANRASCGSAGLVPRNDSTRPTFSSTTTRISDKRAIFVAARGAGGDRVSWQSNKGPHSSFSRRAGRPPPRLLLFICLGTPIAIAHGQLAVSHSSLSIAPDHEEDD